MKVACQGSVDTGVVLFSKYDWVNLYCRNLRPFGHGAPLAKDFYIFNAKRAPVFLTVLMYEYDLFGFVM